MCGMVLSDVRTAVEVNVNLIVSLLEHVGLDIEVAGPNLDIQGSRNPKIQSHSHALCILPAFTKAQQAGKSFTESLPVH